MVKNNLIGPQLTLKQKKVILLSKKLKYILSTQNLKDITVARQFGYEEGGMIAKWSDEKNYNYKIPLMAQESLEKHFKIPLKIWENSFPYNEVEIDISIKEYQDEIKVPHEEVKKIIHKDSFQQNSKYLPFLLGTWYVYSLAIDPKRYLDGVILRITTIHDDYSVKDTDGGIGYLNIRKKESYIEKATREIDNVVLIRFFNEHIVNEILPCSIASSVTNKTNEPLLNFAFMSRKQYDSSEAKRILGEQFKLQLKIDSEFIDRLNKEKESRY